MMLGAALSTAAAQQPALGDATMRVEFSASDGHVRALRDWNNRKLAGAELDSIGLWSLDLAPGSADATINAAQANHFAWRRTGPRMIELTWSDFTRTSAPELKVVATVQLRSDTTTAWRIRIAGIRGVAVDRVRYPRLTHIVTSGSGEELAVPSWMGQRARDPARMLAGNDGKGRRLEFVYPGALSMQAIALSSAKLGGLYFSADDSAAFRKSFALWGNADGSAGYDMVHLLPNPGTLNVFSPSYASIVGVVHGDWFSAVERYRKWGTAQYWARESRLHTGTTPEWLRQTGIWVWNRGHSDVVLEPAADLMQDAKLPVSVFWHWWHNGPYDTSFPDYLPPREGAQHFTNAVKTAHSAGLHAIVYMNQRLWCVNTPSWTREGAERWAVHERDGKLRLETYNVFDPQPCATMDIATPFWRNKYAGLADTVIKQYGVDGIYMDQAVLSLVDWSKDHGHDVGGGNYWMNGFRELAKDLRRRKGDRPTGFAGEGGGESWMPDLDAFLTLQVSQERYADPASGWEVIPMFQAAYHPYALTYGTYGSLTLPPYDELWPVEKRPATAMQLLDPKYVRQFYLEQARMFVWGMQPTIANFRTNQLTERRKQIDYLEQLAKLRYGMRDVFQFGTFLTPPVVEVPSTDVLLSRISIYAARLGGPIEAHTMTPVVLSSAWRSPTNHVAVALASISDDSVDVVLKLPARAYGLRPATRIVRHDINGITPLGTLGAKARSLVIPMKALQGVVIEFVVGNLPDVAAIDRTVRAQVDSGFSGVVLVAMNDRVLLERAYAPPEKRLRPSESFWIASMTKGFTAAAVLRLQQQGRLRVTDSIGRFFSNAPPDKRSITIHQLLTHTSGLGGEYTGGGITERSRAVDSIFSQNLIFPPGHGYKYGDDNYELLAAIIEIASGKSWEDFVRKQLLTPLRLTHTGFACRPGNCDWGHKGANGMSSTAEDLLKWSRAENREITRTRVFVRKEPPLDVSYGYGVRIYTLNDEIVEVMHSGSGDFGHTSIIRNLSDGVTVIVLSNAGLHNGTTWASFIAHRLAAD